MKKWKCECDECKFAPCTMETNNDIRPSCCVAMTGRFSEWKEVKEEEETVTACNQLPKLTAEVFDRPDCPTWAKYAAVDECGSVRLFSDAPWLGESCWNWSHGKVTQLFGVKFDCSDWQNSLIERPAKLPDWVEVGGYVYDARNGYGKIISGSVKSCHIEFDGGAGDFVPEAFSEIKQARLRPYNAEEMKALVGKVIIWDDYKKSFLIIGSSCEDLPMVFFGGFDHTAHDLQVGRYLIDGKPCGVLEHLNENGEWVE